MRLQHLMLEKLATFLELNFIEILLQNQSGLLYIDDLSVRVAQIQHAKTGFVALAAMIAPIHPRHLPTILTLTMSANHFWRGTAGGTFSYDPVSAQLFLSRQFTQEEVEQLHFHRVGEIFVDLFDAAKHWQTVIYQLDLETEQEPLNPRRIHALSFGMQASRLQ